MQNSGDNEGFGKIAIMFAFAFLAAFATGYGKMANNKKMTLTQGIAVILMHSVSGLIFGMVASVYIGDNALVYALSGMGGLMGTQCVYKLYEWFIGSLTKK